MLNLGLNYYRGVQVICSDWREFKDPTYQQNYKRQAIAAPMACALYRQEHVGVIKDYAKGSGEQWVIDTIERLDFSKHIIVAEKALVDILSEEALEALLHHELAHIEHGDLEAGHEAGYDGLFVVDEMELKADAYAAKHTSSKAMLDGLLKVIQYSCSLLPEEIRDKALYESLNTELIKERCRRLA